MIVHIPNVLSQEQVTHCREVMHKASWVDGRVTSGYQSKVVKKQSSAG
jgi:PKHD-type hydroxylase